MIMKNVRLGILGLLSWSLLASNAQAQVKITGGNGTLEGGRVFVPTTGRFIGPGTQADVETSTYYNGTYKGVFIKTELGNLPTNLLFRANLVPKFNTSAGESPVVGTRGEIDGLVSFKALTNSGRPAIYTNIPTTLNIQLTKVPSDNNSTRTTEWNAFNYVLTEVGVGETPTDRSVVTRETGVRLLQYQDRGDDPVSQTVLGRSIPASAYNVLRRGISFGGDVKFDIRSGTFGDGKISSIKLAEILNTDPTKPSTDPTTQPVVYNVSYVPVFTFTSSTTTWYTIPNLVYTPGLDREVTIIVRGREITPSPKSTDKPKVVIDTEEVVYVDRSNNKKYIAIGVPSRVFPNFMGLEEVKLDTDSNPNPNPSPSPTPNPSPSPTPNPSPTPTVPPERK